MALVKFKRIQNRPTAWTQYHSDLLASNSPIPADSADDNGIVLFIENTRELYMCSDDGNAGYLWVKYGDGDNNVQNVEWDSTNAYLTITHADGSESTIDLIEELEGAFLTENIVSITEKLTPNTGYLKTYVITLGTGANNVVGEIDIPKDFLLKSASLVSGNWVNGSFTESALGNGKALKFVVNVLDNSATNSTMYIDVADLFSEYSDGPGIEIANHKIAADFGAGLKWVASTNLGFEIDTETDQEIITDDARFAVDIGNGLEFRGSGLQYNRNRPIDIKIDSTSEKLSNGTSHILSVSSSGLKLSGIGDKINSLVNSNFADRTLSGYAADSTATGAITSSDTLESALNKLINDKKNKLTAVDDTVNASGTHTTGWTNDSSDTDTVVTKVTQDTNGDITVAKNTVGNMLLTGYDAKTGATNSDVKATDSLNDALKKIEEKADSGGVTSVKTAANSYLKAASGSGTAETNVAKLGAVTIDVTKGTIPTPNSSTGAIGTVSSDGLITASSVATAVNAVRLALDGSATASTVAAGTDTTPSADFCVLTKVGEEDGKVQEVATSGTYASKSVKLKKLAATGLASDVAMTGYTVGSSYGVASTDSVMAAIGKIEYQLTWIES